jgi:hypothetical protein
MDNRWLDIRNGLRQRTGNRSIMLSTYLDSGNQQYGQHRSTEES